MICPERNRIFIWMYALDLVAIIVLVIVREAA